MGLKRGRGRGRKRRFSGEKEEGTGMAEAREKTRLLVINPGSTSTKVSVFEGEREVFEESEFHDAPELLRYPHVNDQMGFRRDVVLGMLERHGMGLGDIDVFVGRGGSAHPQQGGVMRVDERLATDTAAAVGGSEHPAKLGVMLAWALARETGKPAYTLNPTNVDEFGDLARVTGIKGVYRTPHSHVLNQKAVAEQHARKSGKRYEDGNYIVAHIDGGITVAAHERGRMIDGNMGADGEGAFTPTRIGSVPVLPLLDYLDAGHTTKEVRLMCSRAGGFVSLFGTADAEAIHAKAEAGDRKAGLAWAAMVYQVCKQIGEMATVLKGRVDAILLTGGLVRFGDVGATVRERCGWIAPVAEYPGELEQEAMAHEVLEALGGRRPVRSYTGKPAWGGFGEIGL